MKHLKLIPVVVFLLLSVHHMYGATDTSKATGNWNNASTWKSGTIPGQNTDVVIRTTDTVKVPSGYTASCRNLQLNQKGVTTANPRLACDTSGILQIYGTLNSDTTNPNNQNLILSNARGAKVVFMRQTSGAITGSNWWGGTGLYMRFEVTLPDSVTGYSNSDVKGLNIRMVSGTWDLQHHEIRPDSNINNTGTLTIDSGAVIKNVLKIRRVQQGNANPPIGTITVNGTMELDSAMATVALKMKPYGIIKEKGPSLFFNAPTTVDLTSAAAKGNVIEYASDVAQTVYTTAAIQSYSGIKFSGNGAKNIVSGTTITINVTDSLIYGDGTWSYSGTINNPTGNMWRVYGGTQQQTTRTDLPATTPFLKINNISGVNLGSSVAISNNLWLQLGDLTAATNAITIQSGKTVTRTKGTISGSYTIPNDITLIYNNLDSIGTSNEISQATLKNLVLKSTSVVTLTKNLTITGVCSLYTGRWQPANKTFTISSSGNIFATNGYVDGILYETVNGITPKNFPVGTISGNFPATMTFDSLNGSGVISAQVLEGPHPAVTFPDSSLKRYWNFTASAGITSFGTSISLTYQNQDIYPGINENTIIVGKFDSTLWTFPDVIDRNPATNAVTIDGITSFSNFLIGKNFSTYIGFPTAQITGRKFNDRNGTGIDDPLYPGLSGWMIHAKGYLSEDSTVTDEEGNYSISNLYAGTYSVWEDSQHAWSQTYPSTLVYDGLQLKMDSVKSGIDFGNFHLATILGSAFNDIDGNGGKDAGEPPIQGLKIYISGAYHDSTLTDVNGNYNFPLIPIGNYIVSEEHQTGWLQTFPDGGTYAVPLLSADTAKNKDFGNFQLGSISGMKFEDVNANGIKDGGELGLADWTIQITGPQNRSVKTIADGSFTFQNLVGGVYTVKESLQTGWTQTTPAINGTYKDTIKSSVNITGRLFGNFHNGIISGIVFNDNNGNGVHDLNDTGIPGWQIVISGPVSDTLPSDGSGLYSFTNLPYGSYSLWEIPQNGWVKTLPASDTVSIFIQSGTNSNANNFGNFQLGFISGTAYTDVNGNGLKDIDDPGLENITIEIAGNTLNTSTNSDVNGLYSFSQLLVGKYSLTETPPSGWIQTQPKNNKGYSVDIVSGSNVTDQNFGLFQLGAIEGFVFNDKNGDGIQQEHTEFFTQDWKIKISGPVNDSLLTGADGDFGFSNLPGGTYTISEVLQTGYFQTAPSSKSFTIIIRSGLDTSNNIIFGNYKLGAVTGKIINDSNGNDTLENGETGFPNIQVVASGNFPETTMTNANGQFSFSLRLGNYTIKPVFSDQFIQTYPTGNQTYSVTITAGSIDSSKNFGIFKLGIISGKVFDDFNGNGIKEQEEAGISQWLVKLSGTKTDSILSDLNGNYSFTHLQHGNYQVSQVVQAGWIKSKPAGNSYTITVISQTNADTTDFGNYRLGSIAGMKFEDKNGNGIKDTNDVILSNWKIRLSGLKTDSTLTDSTGHYFFDNLQIGQYIVTEDLQAGWVQSLPPIADTGKYRLSVSSGSHLTGKDFGNYCFASISGTKWNDLNGNGIKDLNEPGLSGWKFVINGPKNDTLTTDGNGNFSFTNLFTGTYHLSEILKSGWVKTYPAANDTVVTLVSGQNAVGYNFGNFQLGSISGIKFNDLNNDGVKQNTEPAIAGWKIKLSGTKSDSMLTDSNGTYSFNNLFSGNYTVSEENQLGWIQSYPSQPGTYAIVITSGLNEQSKNFGNHLLSSIAGVLYNDINGNGTKDAGEPVQSNWKIFMTGPKTDSTISDENGNYSFYYLTTGTYTIAEQVKTGFVPTEPTNGTRTIVFNQDGTLITNSNFGNFKFGTISGHVFNDLNSDSIRGQEDILLSGWLVRLSGPKSDSLFTDVNGDYQFNGLTVGTYTISELTQAGWVQSAPLGGKFTISILSGKVDSLKDFGNFQLGQISGSVFNDVNANAVQNLEDSAIVHWKVYITAPAFSDSTFTNSSGSFTFQNLYPKDYTIHQETKNSWTATFPPSLDYEVTVVSGSSLSGYKFGNFQLGKISGTKFNDVNGNGARESGESGIPNWKIYITGDRTDSTVTDGDGNYEFSLLAKGNYTIKEASVSGWNQTYPQGGLHQIATLSGTNATGKDFGNFQLGTIGGVVYNDLNSNGTKDAGEPGLSNFKIKLGQTRSDSINSNFNGIYNFSNLPIGSYSVAEVPPAGWEITQPSGNVATGTYYDTVKSGTNITNQNFGNFQHGTISGVAFEDKNGNGLKDPGELPLKNWKIKITNATKAIPDSVVTDSTGTFLFGNLNYGTYTLTEELKNGWVQSIPVGGVYNILVQSNQNITDKNFGNYRVGFVNGVVFNDVNGNGVRDNGEQGIGNWTVYLKGPSTTSTVTDSLGAYSFKNLFVGTYTDSQEVRAGWIARYPSTVTHKFTITSGDSIKNKNFGDYQLGAISGFAFDDFNGNGAFDGNEETSANRIITLTGGDNNVNLRDTTDESGNYSFSGLQVGSYTLSQILNIDSYSTIPVQPYQIVILGGFTVTNKIFGNFQYATISGMAFNDINVNGVKDNNESALPNWKIVLKGITSSDTVSTDGSGVYVFNNVKSGNDTLSQLPKSGWKSTFPATPYPVNITSGTILIGKDFGSYELGIVRGIVFNDMDGNGIQDESDSGLVNWKLTLKSGAIRETTATNSAGAFEFRNIKVGTDTLSQILPSGYAQTFPVAGSYIITDTVGSLVINGKNFGNYKYGSISGMQFHDYNANGIQDSVDTGLQGWKIKLSGEKVDSTLTASNGRYAFNNLTPGTYYVKEVQQAGWTGSKPVNGIDTITIVSGTVSINNDFGSFRNSSISGTAFNDKNGNGVRDGNETGLQGWVIRINGIAGNDSIISDMNGNYSFRNLKPGTYTLSEKLQPTWVQTYPALSGTHTIIVNSNDSITGKLFGNAKKSSITGNVVNDLNGNGVINNGEPGVDGIRIYISGNNMHDTVTTSNFGTYTINNIPPGVYEIGQVQVAGWIQTFPQFPGTYPVTFSVGSDTTGLNFADFKFAQITGIKFEDIDGNGQRDFGEPTLAGLRIVLRGATRNDTTVTDVNGKYTFNNLMPFTYTVSEVVPAGWYQTVPTVPPGRYSVTIAQSGEQISGRDFGNCRYAAISGTVFEDVNGNQVRDDNEPGIRNWNVMLTMKNGTASLLTDSLGRYSFTTVLSGKDTLFAEMRNGMIRTYPDSPGTYPIIVTSGFSVNDYDFGYKNITGVVDEGNIPHVFTLFQNYPNPFNPSTVIKFSVKEQGTATLKLYNVVGEEVITLFDEIAEPGKFYEVTLNGSQLSSGMYFYRLQSEKKVATKKLMLLK